MKTKILVMALAGFLILSISSSAFAFGGGYGAGYPGSCPRLELSIEDQDRFAEVIESFRQRMSELREEMIELRESGEYEAFREKHAERFELMEDKRTALQELLPEEYAANFKSGGCGKRNHGWENGNGGFRNRSNSE